MCACSLSQLQAEHRKYEAERRGRQQREVDMERERKKQVKLCPVTLAAQSVACSHESDVPWRNGYKMRWVAPVRFRRMQEQVDRLPMMGAAAEWCVSALERGLLGDSVARAVAGIASHAQRSLSSGICYRPLL